MAAAAASTSTPLDTLADAASVSNLQSLDDDTKRYLKAFHKKQQLLEQIRELQGELNELKEPILEKLCQTAQAVQICPSQDEEKTYGGMGALVLKVKNDYETLTQAAVVRLLTEFYEYLWPQGNPEEIVSLGEGTASWVWNNRKRTPVRYIERSFAVKAPSKAAKRKSEGAAGHPPAHKLPRAPRFKPVANMPHTRDDFLAIPSLASLIAAPPQLPKQDHDPDAEPLAEGEVEDE